MIIINIHNNINSNKMTTSLAFFRSAQTRAYDGRA